MNHPTCPIPDAQGLGIAEGSGANGVLVLAEALGDVELLDKGLPLRPQAPAGSVFERAIRRAGYDRQEFVLFNTVPTHPPRNYLEGAPYERSAIEWGRHYVDRIVADYQPRCILSLGNIPTKALTGLTGEHRGVASLRGWVLPSRYDIPVVPTYHPSYLRREAMELFPILMHDIKLAVAVAKAKEGETVRFWSPVVWREWEYTGAKPQDPNEPTIPSGYCIYPSMDDAKDFLKEVEGASLIAYDIETPRSARIGEDATDELGEVQILSIQFSCGRGRGIYLPWNEGYADIARRVLSSPVDKAGANTWRFDDPLLEAHGCTLNGRRHDVRWMWHHLQPDLPASLQGITSFYQERDFRAPWKHLHAAYPGFYGIADVDAIQRILN